MKSIATSETGGSTSWERTRHDFFACHRDRRNALLHLVTTPLGLWATLVLGGSVHPLLPILASIAYLLWLPRAVPPRIAWPTAVCVVALLALAINTHVSPPGLLVLVAVAFVGQDLAHRITGETAFDETYKDAPDRLLRWAEHTLLLLPLVLAALTHSEGSAIAWLRPRRNVLRTQLDEPCERADIAALRAWVRSQDAATETSSHWWSDELPDELGAAFDRIESSEAITDALRAHHGEGAVVLGVRGMNEVYVAGPDRRATSDRVFFVPHIDGPFSVFPGATLYRCLVALTPNDRVETCFPLEGSARRDETVLLDEAEVLAFDYHRTPHFIREVSGNPMSESAERRATLKLHYVVAPAGLSFAARWLAALSTRYNARARALFLDTLEPTTPLARATARAIVFQTHLWQWLARWAGHRNLAFLAILAVASLVAGSATPFVAGGSFVHYFLYMAVFGSRDDVSFGTFKRDAIFYKTLSMTILGTLYLAHWTFDPVSMILIAGGFGLSALAASALGMDRTYFAAELGHAEPTRIDRFPYGVVPHPMILGSIVGLVGIAWLEPFRSAWPWLVPTHIALYLCHLLQEVVAPPIQSGSSADGTREPARRTPIPAIVPGRE